MAQMAQWLIRPCIYIYIYIYPNFFVSYKHSTSELHRNIGWLHWYGVVCWALLQPILLSSVAPHKVHGALAPSVQPIEVFSVCHLHAPPPDRSVPLQWLAPQFGMASLCRYAHSL